MPRLARPNGCHGWLAQQCTVAEKTLPDKPAVPPVALSALTTGHRPLSSRLDLDGRLRTLLGRIATVVFGFRGNRVPLHDGKAAFVSSNTSGQISGQMPQPKHRFLSIQAFIGFPQGFVGNRLRAVLLCRGRTPCRSVKRRMVCPRPRSPFLNRITVQFHETSSGWRALATELLYHVCRDLVPAAQNLVI